MSLKILMIGLPVENPCVEKVDNTFEAPSLFDYDIVIADADSILLPNLRDEIPMNEYLEVDKETISWFEKVTQKLSKETRLLIEKGGMLVCIMRPKRGMTYNWWDYSTSRKKYIHISNYDWIPIENLDYRIAYGSGKRKKLCDETSPFADYIKMPETYWTAYFEDIDILNVQNRILAFNDANKPIAAEVLIDKGSIVFLPISDHEKVGDILLECAVNSVRQTEERPPPTWLKELKVPTEDNDRKSLLELNEKMTALQAEYNVVMNALDEKTVVKKLVYEKNKPLEEAVKKSFEELGFTCTKKDDKDWVASSETGEAILEVTGSDGTIDIVKLRQLLNYIIDDYKESEVEKKAILVANHFANKPPKDRGESFSKKVIAESKVHSICLLSTLELFKIICYLREGKIKREDVRKKLFETVGLLKLE